MMQRALDLTQQKSRRSAVCGLLPDSNDLTGPRIPGARLDELDVEAERYLPVHQPAALQPLH